MALFNQIAEKTTHIVGENGVKAALSSGGAATTGVVPISASSIPGGVGVAAIVGAVLAQMEYKQRKEELKELYRDELAAQLKKPAEKVTTEDFDKLAERNHTIREQLAKTKTARNLGVGVIAIGTFAAVVAAFSIMGVLGSLGVTIAAPTAFAAGAMKWLATTAVAMITYGVIKPVMQKVGERMFGVDQKTTHERIEKMFGDHTQGKVISRERVLDVFVHATPPLDAFIKKEYGVSFDKLKPVDKLQLADSNIGKQLGVAELTEAINQGKIRSTELAFAVEGKFSGVAPTTGDKPKHTLMETVSEKAHNAAEKISETAHNAADKMHHMAEKFTGHHPANDKPVGFSFAERERARAAANSQLAQR